MVHIIIVKQGQHTTKHGSSNHALLEVALLDGYTVLLTTSTLLLKFRSMHDTKSQPPGSLAE